MIFPQEQTHLFSHELHCNYQSSKMKQVEFSRIYIKKALPAPTSSVLQVIFKFKSQLQVLSQIRCLITLKLERSIINIDIDIIDNIKKIINVQQKKHKTKDGALRSTSVNRICLQRLPSQNHLNLSVSEKRCNKAKHLNRNYRKM